MKMRQVASVVLAIPLATKPGFAAETDRAKEAIAIFQIVASVHALTSMQGPPTRCQYARSWDNRAAVPEKLAQDFFGLKVHAELSSFESELKPEEIIDPRREHPEAFCTTKDDQMFRRDILVAFENNVAVKKMLAKHTSFAFPIFDENYTKAAVAVGEFAEERKRGADGKIERDLPEAATVVHFLEKGTNGWKLVRSETLGLT